MRQGGQEGGTVRDLTHTFFFPSLCRITADFTITKEGEIPTRDVPRFLPNPTENWGPGARATGKKRLFFLFFLILFCFVLFCFVLFCFVLFCFVLFCFVLFFCFVNGSI